MGSFAELFPTLLYRARLNPSRNRLLEKTALAIAAEDKAGLRWAKSHGYGGYTSYASLNDLARRASIFADLERDITRHVRLFGRRAGFALSGRKLVPDSLWINVMEKGGVHAAHIHPHAAISGTYYVTVPDGSGAIKFEDPRLPLMMAAPAKKETVGEKYRNFVTVAPAPGQLLLWESWLRHGVETHRARTPRVSISFNYRLD